MTQSLARLRLAACLATVGLIAIASSPAQARSWSFSGPRGGAWNRSVTHYNNGGGNFGRTVVTTRPNGKTATSSFSRSVNGSTITDSHSVTGYNGRTASGTLTRTPGQGGTATYTGRGGQTYTGSFSR